MRTSSRNHALTLTEFLVAIFVVAVLLSLACIAIRHGLLKGQVAATLNNARQLYIAGFSMATDFKTQGDDHLGWPGDLAERKTEPVTTVSQYIERLIRYDYLKAVDMQKVMQAPGVVPWDTSKPFDVERNCPFKIYKVKEPDGPEAIFCATKNFKYNDGLDEKKVPYRDECFGIFRKGGDGAFFTNKKMARPSNLSTLGLLPGRKDFQTRNVETPDDYLLPK